MLGCSPFSLRAGAWSEKGGTATHYGCDIQGIKFNGQNIPIPEEMNLFHLWQDSSKSRGHNPDEWMPSEQYEFITTFA